ncbi:MAG: hypothetical protein Q7J54_02445 [Candidatus Woesearchaeota archaeon]|nr:hypothetical protein [Candidatus Woesearchaeota archaeon]
MKAKNKTEKFFCAHCKTYYKHDEKNKQAMTCGKCLKKGLNDEKALRSAEEIMAMKYGDQKVKMLMVMHRRDDMKGHDRFLLNKYLDYLRAAIVDLENTNNVNSFFWEDNQFNTEQQKKKRVDTVYIDEKELLKLFVKKLKEDNIHRLELHLYSKAVDLLLRQGSVRYRPDECFDDDSSKNFFIEKIKMNGKPLLRVMF